MPGSITLNHDSTVLRCVGTGNYAVLLGIMNTADKSYSPFLGNMLKGLYNCTKDNDTNVPHICVIARRIAVLCNVRKVFTRSVNFRNVFALKLNVRNIVRFAFFDSKVELVRFMRYDSCVKVYLFALKFNDSKVEMVCATYFAFPKSKYVSL